MGFFSVLTKWWSLRRRKRLRRTGAFFQQQSTPALSPRRLEQRRVLDGAVAGLLLSPLADAGEFVQVGPQAEEGGTSDSPLASSAANDAATVPSLISGSSSSFNNFSYSYGVPTVLSVTPSDVLLSDADVGSGTLEIAVQFDEAMITDGSSDPTLTFAPTVDSTLTLASGSWSSDAMTYTATYDVFDAGVTAVDIDVSVEGARNIDGILQEPSTMADVFGVDTRNPSIVGMTSSTSVVTDADVGAGNFSIDLTYSEVMTIDGSADPIITFTPSVANTLTFSAGVWLNSTTYRATYDVADANETLVDVAASVGGGRDAEGNQQIPRLDTSFFSIDTEGLSGDLSIESLTVTPSVNENGVAQLELQIFDPTFDSSHTVEIDWGDGSALETFALPVEVTALVTTHQYLDDNPTGTPSDTYTVQVRVVDDEEDSVEGTAEVEVINLAPTNLQIAPLVAVDENGFAQLQLTFDDLGSQDTHTVEVDWGDGTALETFSLDPGARSLATTHQYLDDNPSGTSSDINTVSVRVLDDDGGQVTTLVPITVSNLPPTNLQIQPLSPIDEFGLAQLQLTFDDLGSQDVHTVEVDWGDGTPLESFGLSAGARSLGTVHQYLDDDPTATPQDDYTIQVKVLDDDDGEVTGTATVTVRNVAPAIISVLQDQVIKSEGDTFNLSVEFTDPGTLDTHTYVVDWGDGIVTNGAITGRNFVASHIYTEDGTFTVEVRVLDDDTGVGTSTFETIVENAPPTSVQIAPLSAIDENDFAQLQVTFDDPGSQDTHTVEVDWGDGSALETFNLVLGTQSLATTHQYLDDDPTATSQDVYTVQVRVLDDEGGVAIANAPITVRNVAPGELVVTVTPETSESPAAPAGGGGGETEAAETSDPIVIDLLEGTDDAEQELLAALLASESGISVVPGSERFVGRLGDGDDPNLAQSATLSNLVLTPSDGSLPVVDFGGGGIFLTTGVANIPFTNTSTSFGSGDAGVSPPSEGVAADTADLEAILAAAGQSIGVNNVNLIEFEFTVVPGTTSIEAEFVFGSDEFPDQAVTDVFAFIVDGTNFALFPDGSLVSFVQGENAANFNDNGTGAYNIEYDGISNVLRVVGLLDADIPDGGTHTLKIAIANTSDSAFDSGVFLGRLQAGTADGGGVEPPSQVIILENGVVDLDLSFVDVGTQDSHTVTIDWGDGTVETIEIAPVGGREAMASHRYLDDNPTGTPEDTYTINVTVADDDLGQVSSQSTVVVRNVAPSNLQISPLSPIDENGLTSLQLTFDDPGLQDTHVVEVNWGDGTPLETFNLDPGARSLATSHQYLDDNPTGTPSDVNSVQVRVLDDDGGEATADVPITVNNVAPTNLQIVTPDPINENGIGNLQLTFDDVGSQDTHTVVVDWGDGTALETFTLDPGARSLATTHQYLDDDPTVTPQDEYTIQVTVLDDDTGEVTGSVEITANNLAPSNLQILPLAPIDENGIGQLQLTFDDAGTLDVHTVEVDWGDGSALETFTLDPGARSFATSHQYLDDNPTGTPQDDYTVQVKVLDDDGGEVTGSAPITVRNVAPNNFQFVAVATINENDFAQLQFTFEDPGTQDTHTVVIDWADGTVESFDLDPGARSFSTSHQYLDDNPTDTSEDDFVIGVTITDDDTQSGFDSTPVTVENVAPTNLVLTVTPSLGNDPAPSNPTPSVPSNPTPSAPLSLGSGPVLTSTGTFDPIELNLLEGTDDPEQELIAALLASGSGVSVVSGSERFVGRLGDGVDPNLAQSATFPNFSLVPSDGSRPNIALNGGGIFLTSGVANIPFTNTDTSFGASSVGVSAPSEGVAGDTDDLENILTSAGQSTNVNNVNLIEFEFTVAPGTTSIEAEFVFASDEFPDQSVTDIFAFIVDGTNFALFPDGSLVSFVQGQNASNFNDNVDGAYEIEYDGISNVLRVVGLLDDSIPEGGAHTLKIAIANTSDTVFDSGVFVGPLVAGTAEDGGIEQPSTTESITGFKFEDLDGDGVRGAGEPGLAGVTIFVDANDNGVLDPGEISTVTQQDNPATAADETGRFSFAGLDEGTFIVREVVTAGFVPTSPVTSTVVDPTGVNNPTSGIVSPSLIDLTLASGEVSSQTVSLTLPDSGGTVSAVDIFLLFDDTGSFAATVPAVSAVLQSGISELQALLPDISFGFGGGRFEDFGGPFSGESRDVSSARPFILNQPIITTDTVGFAEALNAALSRDAPGGGGDGPETLLEALFQIATGLGFDGNGNGSLLDSGPAGLATTQTNPGNSGDIPPFSSFVPDLANNILPPAGSVGGVGFRQGALPIIIVASDIGTVFRPEAIDPIEGVGGVTVPLSAFLPGSRPSTPDSDGDGNEDGASIQQTISALNDLGALVLGLGTNDSPLDDPRIVMEAIATLTGAVNGSSTSIDSNIPSDPIDPGDPLYFLIDESVSSNVVDGIVTAIQSAITNVSFDVDVRPSDPSVSFVNTTGVLAGIGEGDTATFDVQFTGNDTPHRFDLQFVRAGTDVELGSIPVEISSIVFEAGSRTVVLDANGSVSDVNFGNQRIPVSGNVVILENDSVDLDISYFDVGTLDTFTVTIDWGDNSPLETIENISAGDFSENSSHRYLDDDPTSTPQDTYTIIVSVIDDDTGAVVDTSEVLVINVAPRLTPALLPGETPPDETEPAPLAGTDIDQGISIVTGSFGDRSVAGTESFTIFVDWGDDSGLEAFTFDNVVNPQNFTLTHDYNPLNLPVELLPPVLNSAGDVTISLTLMDDDLGIDTDFVVVRVFGTNPDGGVSIDTTPQVPRLVFQRPAEMGLALDNGSKGDESLQGLDIRSSGGETKAVSERFLVIYEVDLEGRTGEEQKLKFEVLDNLLELFRKLPDNHYKIDLIHEETGTRRPVLDVYVREGTLIEPDDDTEGTRDRPPMDITAEEPADELEKKIQPEPGAIELEEPADELFPLAPEDNSTSMHSISRELAWSLHRGRENRSLALAPIAAGLVATSSFASWAQQVDQTVAAAGSQKWHRLRWRRFPVRKNHK